MMRWLMTPRFSMLELWVIFAITMVVSHLIGVMK